MQYLVYIIIHRIYNINPQKIDLGSSSNTGKFDEKLVIKTSMRNASDILKGVEDMKHMLEDKLPQWMKQFPLIIYEFTFFNRHQNYIIYI